MTIALSRFFPVETSIGFIQHRFIAFAVSLVLMLGSVGALFTMGLNFGIDFRGGTLIEITADDPDIAEVRQTLTGLNLGEVQVQEFGAPEDLLIRVATVDPETLIGREGVPEDLDAEQAQQYVRVIVQEALDAQLGEVEYQRVEVVGPQVSGELVTAGVTAVLIALFLMLVYIWFRFEWQYSVGAVLALSHDVIATLGLFAITQMEFSLPTIAAMLTIVGYSMNDTVVVYDRMREMFRKYKTRPTTEVIDIAINATLSRTLMTSGTTLIALVALALLGGTALESFAYALIFGVLIGTYSSIFVAAPLLTITGVKRTSDNDTERAGA